MAPRLKLDLEGIALELEINEYQPYVPAIWDEQWCEVGFSLASGEWLNYRIPCDELLLSGEVERLAGQIEKLLNGGLDEVTAFVCIEPDFQFRLYPKQERSEGPGNVYIPLGHEIEDVRMEWLVYFWNGGLTDNYLSLALDREDLGLLLNYLHLITGKLKRDSQEIRLMMDKGQIYG